MSKLSERVQWLWIEAQLGSPVLIQDKVIPRLHNAKDAARPLLKPYLTVYQWRGQNEGGPLTVSYAGFGYAAPFIRSILFVEEPTVTRVGKLPIWRSRELANSSDSDIVIIEASKHLIHKLPGNSAFTMPFQVSLVLDAQGSWEEVKSRFNRHLRKNELRFVRKYGYVYDVSYDDEDFEMYYHTMYLPSLKIRYSALASPMPVQEAYQSFRHGLLFLVRRDGRCVSGALCTAQRDVVDIKSLGVANADEQLMREGAQGAAWYATIHWSNQEGYKHIDFGGCWPYIEGVFLYKRKWGSTASISPRHANKRIWIKVQRDTPAVFQFLSDNPSVIIDKTGELRVLMVTADSGKGSTEVEARWHRLYAMPGLSGPLICSVGDLLDS
jgi:hypothetical protein